MTDYIYALTCPQGEIRYIGKTKNLRHRLNAHIAKARSGQTNHHASNWIRSLIAKGESPRIEMIFEVPEDDPWQPYEIALIAEFKAKGHRLTNATGGGDGFFDASPESIAKRVAASKITKSTPEYREYISLKMREVRANPEFKERASESLKKAWADPETRKNFIAGMNTPEGKAGRSAATKRRYDCPEARARHVERQRQVFKSHPEMANNFLAAARSPETRKKAADSLRVTVATPEHRAKMSEINREIGSRPEVKAKKAKAARDNYDGSGLALTVKSDEFKTAQSERLKGRWKDKDQREKMEASWTQERRQKQADMIRARKEKIQAAMTPEVRARQGAKMKEWWARKKAAKLLADEQNNS